MTASSRPLAHHTEHDLLVKADRLERAACALYSVFRAVERYHRAWLHSDRMDAIETADFGLEMAAWWAFGEQPAAPAAALQPIRAHRAPHLRLVPSTPAPLRRAAAAS